MNQKTFCFVTGMGFLVVALLHLTMFILNQSVAVGGLPTPVWANLIIALGAGYFAFQGLKLGKKS